MKIQEIAKRAGVSTATVSRVFSNHPNIREELRERVLAAARQAGYHPRLSQKQQNVVVISPLREIYPIRSYVEMVISELALTLSARGYRIEMLPSDNLSQLERIRFCGAVSIGVDVESFGNWEERFAAPLVVIDRDVPPTGAGEIYSIRSDENQAMHLGIECLARHGCRKVGVIIYGKADMGNTGIRHGAVLRALRANRLPAAMPESSPPMCFRSTTGAFRRIFRWSLPNGACTPVTRFRRKPRSRRTTPHRRKRSQICSTPVGAASPSLVTRSFPTGSSNATA